MQHFIWTNVVLSRNLRCGLCDKNLEYFNSWYWFNFAWGSDQNLICTFLFNNFLFCVFRLSFRRKTPNRWPSRSSPPLRSGNLWSANRPFRKLPTAWSAYITFNVFRCSVHWWVERLSVIVDAFWNLSNTFSSQSHNSTSQINCFDLWLWF